MCRPAADKFGTRINNNQSNKGVSMKKIGVFSLAAMLATSAFAADDLAAMKAELEALKSQVVELKKNQETADLATLAKQVKELKMRTGGDNVKWDIDYRASVDSIRYNMASSSMTGVGTTNGAPLASDFSNLKMTNGISVPNKAANSSLITNRLILGMKAAPTKDTSFIGKLSYNKAMGDTANHSQSNTQPGYANFDWVTNENATDNTVKVKEAYFIYFGDAGPIPYTASIGRRPSYDGLPGNLREGNADANSPLSHLINVEYDGASFKFDLDKVTGVSGMYFKLCMGKGLTNAKQRFSMDGQNYAKDNTKNADVDLAGFIFVPYDDGQYSVHSMFFKAHNMIGFTQYDMYKWQAAAGNLNGLGGAAPAATDVAIYMNGIPFHNVGNLYGGTVLAMANGIGSGWGDFLDNTTAFVSYAFTKTQPNGLGMLGSRDSKFGSSWWAGLQMPAVFTKDGKIGIEYNQGSKYWRSMTYGEDTMAGSKLAARGKAWEGYYNQPLTKHLDMQVRYTYISYDYTGSNGFFGDDGAPISMDAAVAQGQNPVKSASDARAYIRYRY
jgi:hypothetical protein